MRRLDTFDKVMVVALSSAVLLIATAVIFGLGDLKEEIRRLKEKDSEAIVILKEQTDLLKTKLKEERRTVVQLEKKILKMKAEYKKFAKLTGQFYGTRKE